MKVRSIIVILSIVLYVHTVNPCSIVAYIGSLLCKVSLLKRLKRLEYRGYDSAGFACHDLVTKAIVTLKKPGKLEVLKELALKGPCDGYAAIGHTRWATHGEASENNAHPHRSSDGKVVGVHNGIIENHYQIKQQLSKEGVQFKTETDTEVMIELLAKSIKKMGDLKEGVLACVRQLKGACSCVALHQDFPDLLIVVRQRSPLCIGLGKDGMHVASDFLAFADETDTVFFMPESSVAIVRAHSIDAFDYDGNSLPIELKKVHLQPSAYEKLDHEHFMLKEIYEQRGAIERTIAYYNGLGDDLWSLLGLDEEQVENLRSLNLFGCGTSWHAARIGQFFFESIANLPTSVHLASEFRYMKFFAPEDSLFVAISQSGETADTLELIRYFREQHAHVIALTNSPMSSMVRETDGHLLIKAGPEIAVASTKAFSTQLTGLYWLAHRIALQKGLIDELQMRQAEYDLCYAAQVLEKAIEQYKVDIIVDAAYYAQFQRIMYLGRHVTYPFALEGALKLKEISYIFAQGYPAGELKHGSIALIDEHTPIVLFSHQDPVIYQKLISNAQEVKARKGHLIAFVFEGQDELIKLADKVYIVPHVAPLLEPLAMTGLMQFFAYQIALVLGRDIDKPRNLAKAVTVE